MTFLYEVSVGNPEGTDWTCKFEHEKEMSQDEFDDIVEKAFLETISAAEKKWMDRVNELGDVSKKSLGLSSRTYATELDAFYEIMKSKGFKELSRYAPTACYYLEPYWGTGSIKNKELRSALERSD